MLPGPQGVFGEPGPAGADGPAGAAGAAGQDGGGTVEVFYSNVDLTTYATSGLDYFPLAKNATEQYVKFTVKAWKAGTMKLDLTYAMSVSNGGDVAMSAATSVIEPGDDPDQALTESATFTFTPGAGATEKEVSYEDEAELGVAVDSGDLVVWQIRRKNVGGDTHTGSFNLQDVHVRIS